MCISNSFKDFYGLLSFELFRNADRLLYLITQNNTSNLVILLVFSHSCNSMVLITVTTSQGRWGEKGRKVRGK